MTAWPTWESKRIAFLLGACLYLNVRWPKPYFVPEDSFGVAAFGPEYHSVDDLGFEAAVQSFEEKLGITLPKNFWDDTFELTYGQVVEKVQNVLAWRGPTPRSS